MYIRKIFQKGVLALQSSDWVRFVNGYLKW